MTINFKKETSEVLEINNIIYTVMPSDISMYSDNAVYEKPYFRSKGAYAFRSRHSKSQINITFPIPLLNTRDVDKYPETERNLFENGLKLIAQLGNHPFCYIRSARLYSYLGVSYQTPEDYLMFGVAGIKIVQDSRVSNTLMVDVELLLNNTSNLVKGFNFVNGFKINAYAGFSTTSTTPYLTDSYAFGQFMTALHGDVLSTYENLLKEIGAVDIHSNFKAEESLTNVLIKMPYVSTEDAIRIVNNNSEVVADLDEESSKNIEYHTFKMYDRGDQGDLTFDGDALKSFSAKYDEDMEFINNPDLRLQEYRMYYLADKNLYDPSINAIQSITVSKQNNFAQHHIGSSQHPFLQFLGKYPARMDIVSVYNSVGSYEVNEKSTLNLFKIVLNSIDTNNTVYPGANAYNFLKIKSLATAFLKSENMMPSSCNLSTSSNNTNSDIFVTSFIESSMDKMLEESKVRVGREIVNSKQMKSTLTSISLYLTALYSSIETETKDSPVDYKRHSQILKNIARLSVVISEEGLGNNYYKDVKRTSKEEEKVDKGSEYFSYQLRNGVANKEMFLKLKPYAFETVNLLATRIRINNEKSGRSVAKDNNAITLKGYNGEWETKSDTEVYNFSSEATDLINKISADISIEEARGDLKITPTSTEQIQTIAQLNDVYLYNSFTGYSHTDLGLDRLLPGEDQEKYIRHLDPLFYLQTTPILNKLDFYQGFDLMNTASAAGIREALSREITDGVLTGQGENNEKLISEISGLKEARYIPSETSAIKGEDSEGSSSYSNTAKPGSKEEDVIKAALNFKGGTIECLGDHYTRRLVASLHKTESYGSGGISATNKSGFIGKYQFGAPWLYDAGFLKNHPTPAMKRAGHSTLESWGNNRGPNGHDAFLKNTANWKNGWSRAKFLSDGAAQDKALVSGTNNNCNYLRRNGYINNNTPKKEIAGLLKGMHLGGPKGLKNRNASDINKTSVQKYINDIAKNGDGLDGLLVKQGSANNGTPSTDYKPISSKKSSHPKSNAAVTERGVVQYVSDADTIKVKLNGSNKTLTVRLAGINAPETAKPARDGASRTPGQFYGKDATVWTQAVILNKKVTLNIRETDKYGRAVADVLFTDGSATKSLGEELLKNGLAYADTYKGDPYFKSLETSAKKKKVGLWTDKNKDKTMNPSKFLKIYNEGGAVPEKYLQTGDTNPKDRVSIRDEEIAGYEATATPTTNPQGSSKVYEAKGKFPVTNDFLPVAKKDFKYISSAYGIRKNPSSAARKANGSAGSKGWHPALDVAANHGVPIYTPCSGSVSSGDDGATRGRGKFVHLVCDAKGFEVKFFHMSKIKVRRGHVEAGDVVGYVGTTGSSTGNHVHYEVSFNGVRVHPQRTTPLDMIPKNQILKSTDFLAKNALISDSKMSTSALSWDAGAKTLHEKMMLSDSKLGGSSFSGRQLTPQEIKGYSVQTVAMDAQMSVFDENLQAIKHIDKMFSNFEMGLNVCFPVMKAYALVGNESDSIFDNETAIKPSVYFELPLLDNLSVATNNDMNPVDVCTFSMMNPNSVRTSTEYYGSSSFGANVYNIDTQYYNMFFANRIKLTPGMKIHIRAGYSNQPNKLKTIFNGVVKEVSGHKDPLLNVVCESYGAELVSNTFGFNKPWDMSGGRNASTGLLIAYSLLNENISHFGSKVTKTKVWLSYANFLGTGVVNTVKSNLGIDLVTQIYNYLSGTEAEPTKDNEINKKGDYRDPESKPLVSPMDISNLLFMFNPSRANLPQRLFTNIYSDAIDAVHDQYSGGLLNRLSKGLQFLDSEYLYSYYAFRSTTWSIIKEMEYRHPGTLAKPLWYEERMTMFFGIKEQLYIAKDLTPSFMLDSGKAALYEDLRKPYTSQYLVERHKRLEPATGFHLLSSKLNIISNNLSISRDFATRINAMYYTGKYEGNQAKPDSDVTTVTVDDNISAFDIREETIALNGCNDKYMGWMYGINELKKQLETMYKGEIIVTGKPDMRAGDFAYIEDNDRGMSGVIKIRECHHHFSPSRGYITVITPGLHVECTQFYWSTLFTQLGMASKISLMKAELDVTNLLTTNKIADSYYDYLKVIQDSSNLSFSDTVVGLSGSFIVAGISGYTMLKMASKSSYLKKGASAKQVKAFFDTSGKVSRYIGSSMSSGLNSQVAKAVSSLETKIGSIQNKQVRVNSKIASRFSKNLAKVSKMKLGKYTRLPLRFVSTINGIGLTMLRGVVGGIATNPIGALVVAIGAVIVSALISKFKELELTHNPLIMYPLVYNGKPYVAGISGYENNSIWEAWMSNLEKNVKQFRKSAHAIRVTSQGTSLAADATAGVLEGAAGLGEGVVSLNDSVTKLTSSTIDAVTDFLQSDSNEEY